MSDPNADVRLKHVYGMIPAERDTSSFAKIELPGGGGVANAYSMARLYAMLVNGCELQGGPLLRPETIAIGLRHRVVHRVWRQMSFGGRWCKKYETTPHRVDENHIGEKLPIDQKI